MQKILHSFVRSVMRVYPRCITQSQAVAFNMFLAFFPILLLALGVFSSTAARRTEVREIVEHMRGILPPGSQQLVIEFLTQRSAHPWRWFSVGLGGTLLVGTQVMKLLVSGFHIAADEPDPGGYWVRQGRALLLLVVTIVPWLASVVLTVFGKQLRAWLIHQTGMPVLVRALWFSAYSGAVLLVAMLILALVYRVGGPSAGGWKQVLPGAAVATLLWWVANGAFGFYVRHVPYSLVYGGLAAAIGLMVWMQLTAMILLLGSAFNAEFSQSPGGQRPRVLPITP